MRRRVRCGWRQPWVLPEGNGQADIITALSLSHTARDRSDARVSMLLSPHQDKQQMLRIPTLVHNDFGHREFQVASASFLGQPVVL